MLVLTRKIGETIRIGEAVEVQREDIYERIVTERRETDPANR